MLGEAAAQTVVVYIAKNRAQRCHGFQLLSHSVVSDIAGVPYFIAAFQQFENLRVHVAVRIAEKTYFNQCCNTFNWIPLRQITVLLRYFLKLSYRGTHFHGWQVQPNALTVQAHLQDRLQVLLGRETPLVGAGRTDTGVHALQMFAHFDTPELIENHASFLHRFNSLLGPEIAVQALLSVGEHAHARFDALERRYQYHLCTAKDPFRADRAYHVNFPLEWDAMQHAAQALPGKRDFSSFSKSRTQVKTNICELREARWEQVPGGWVFHVAADRFLRNMVRAMVGTLLEVGKGRMTAGQVEQLLQARDRRLAGESVPAHGLFLTRVVYPQAIFLDGRQH